ncbi:MAG TPA: valine--tRNA ligase [Firmicutes bacterium]|nr:valine--tRNA ligase [Bacillota bacterium]
MKELPKYYGGLEAEKKWQRFWEEKRIFSFNENKDKPVYSVDTPPPTVSGQLHIGHVFSYTQAEIMTRYKRMRGFQVFYPFGFDDNGLPTERLVEKKLKKSASSLDREEFIAHCLEVSADVEKEFKELWQSLGFSADWGQLYSTIDERSRRISQRSFIDLFEKGHVVHKATPALYCPYCRTTVAQAETEDKEFDSEFVDLAFTLETGEELIISTTRPELLPALTAVFVHPEDTRYSGFHNMSVKPPLFDISVALLSDEKVDIEKGSGAVMCCTFGDSTDVEWYHTHALELRQAIDENGRMNELAGPYQGMKVKEARQAIIKDLEEGGYIRGRRQITHPVNTHDRCGREMEFIVKKQWFIKILEKKEELIQLADTINWYPEFMKERYIHWVSNLKWDWGISRQRYFGVPFPLWYCAECGAPVTADKNDLPVNPMTDSPNQPCPACGNRSFIPEKDVLDTWATSSVTPQINGKWGEPDDRMDQIFPMDLRPQAHDIIRTWAFYTIVKSYYHHGQAPWKNIMISGHSLDPERKKISKSKGNVGQTPQALVAQYTADPVRYWTAGSRLGMDTFFSEDVLKDGRKLVTKLWNASKFVLMNLEGYSGEKGGTLNTVDEWILQSLRRTVKTATDYMERYEYGLALQHIESFFWKDLCDNYIELVKGKIKEGTEDERKGSQWTLFTVLYGTLRLFAPFVPHITEEIYQLYFADFIKEISIHLAPWPLPEDFPAFEKAEEPGKKILAYVEFIRKAKSENKLSLAYPIAVLDDQGYGEKHFKNNVLKQIDSLLKIEKRGPLKESDAQGGDAELVFNIKWGER